MAEETKGRSNSEWCSAINCTNSRKKNPLLSFFRFPKDPERCKRWVINVRRDDLHSKPVEKLHKNNVVCALHFEASQFMNPNEKRKRLVHNAVPTVFDIPNPPQRLTPSRPPPKKRPAPQTTSEQPSKKQTNDPPPCEDFLLSENTSASREEELQKELLAYEKKIELLEKKVAALRQRLYRKKKATAKPKQAAPKFSFEEIKDILSEHVSGETLNFMLSQVRVGKKSKYARRWTVQEKSIALSLFHSSPKSYRLLKSIFYLPSIKTLRRSVSNINMKPGFCSNILNAFKIKISAMKPEERVCSLIFDEMSIKECVEYDSKSDVVRGFEDYGTLGRTKYVSNHALVFMARGVFSNWKQPFGYFFSSGTIKDSVLKELVLLAIQELERTGVTVKAIVCDQGSNNTSVLRSLGVSSETPFFDFNGSRKYVIYDPPHLLKNVRNNLKKNGLKCGEDIVTWGHIEAFYEQDCKLPLRMAPKLTDKHIRLPPFASLRVKLAAQVLSHTVAAGISTMAQLGALPKEAEPTARFIDMFDKIFNCLNSYSLKSTRPYQHALSTVSNHKGFLTEALSWLDRIEGNSKVKKLPCIEGWKVSISSTLQLFAELCDTYNVSFMLTSRLNQDCLENLFSCIRGKGGHRDNPDCGQFTSSLQQCMIDKLMLSSSSKNCKDDLDSFLFGLQNLSKPDTSKSSAEVQNTASSSQSLDSLHVPSLLNIQQGNVIAYICGYIYRKVSAKLCSNCKHSLLTTEDNHVNHVFIQHKRYSASSTLYVPSVFLMEICSQLEAAFTSVCETMLHSEHVMASLRNHMVQKVSVAVPACENCNFLTLVTQLFLTIRLHHSLRESNKSFVVAKTKRNRKMLKLAHV